MFAPVVRQSTFRLFLTIAGQKNLLIKHFDAKTAFLNGDLKEEVYMQQPEGFQRDNDLVCKLNKSLYGLKQSAKVWNDKVDEILSKYDFCRGKADFCLYTKLLDNQLIYVIVHVDDFLIASKSVKNIDLIAGFLSKHFDLSDIGYLRNYLSISVQRNNVGIYSINQTKYIDKLLCRFGMQDAKDSAIPLDTGYLKCERNKQPMKDNENFQKLIGGLLYVSVNSRPDIAASVNILSQHNKEPLEIDWNELKRILRYLKKTKYKQLVLGDKSDTNILYGFADADWAENKEDRKSNSGYLFKVYGATISWASRKQTCVALSSTEAEFIALAEASQEAIWLKELIKDFGIKSIQVTILEDNQSCLKYVSNQKFSNRTKHIDTKYHFVKNLSENDIINFIYCPSENMLADMLTKPLSRVKLSFLSKECGLIG